MSSATDIICNYIYVDLKVLQASIDAVFKLLQNFVRRFEVAFNATMQMVKSMIEDTLVGLMELIDNCGKSLLDLVFNNSGIKDTIFCNNLFKCMKFIKELVEPNSLFQKHFFKSKRNKAIVENIYDVISDFNMFTDTVCTYGFSLNLGTGIFKSLVKTLLYYVKWAEDFLSEWRDYVHNWLQGIFNKYYKSGLFDLLDELSSYFLCILDPDSDSCAAIETAQNKYNNTLAGLHIKEHSTGYSFDSDWEAKYTGWIDNWYDKMTEYEDKYTNLAKQCSNPFNASNTTKAFDLAKFFVGDNKDSNGLKFWNKFTFTDGQAFSLKTFVLTKWFVVSWEQLVDAWNTKVEEEKCDDHSTDELINSLTIDDLTQNIYLTVDGARYDIVKDGTPTEDMGQCVTEQEGTTLNLNENADIGYCNKAVLDKFSGNIRSLLMTANYIHDYPNSDFALDCQAIYKNYNDMVNVDDAVLNYK